jgi:CRP-like cAMP-binding protein
MSARGAKLIQVLQTLQPVLVGTVHQCVARVSHGPPVGLACIRIDRLDAETMCVTLVNRPLDGRHSVTAVASSEVIARQVERQVLLRRMKQDAVCLRQVLWLVNAKLRVLANQYLLLSQATAAQRVIHHLVQLADTYCKAVMGGIAIRIPSRTRIWPTSPA